MILIIWKFSYFWDCAVFQFDKIQLFELFEIDENGKIVIEKLLQHGANINANDQHQQTALHIAAREGSDKIVDILIKNQINVNATDDVKATALHRAAEQGKHIQQKWD